MKCIYLKRKSIDVIYGPYPMRPSTLVLWGKCLKIVSNDVGAGNKSNRMSGENHPRFIFIALKKDGVAAAKKESSENIVTSHRISCFRS